METIIASFFLSTNISSIALGAAVGISLVLLLLLLNILLVPKWVGWQGFYNKYKAPDYTSPVGSFKRILQSVRFGRSLRFQGVAIVEFSEKGLYISSFPPFRWIYRPVLIPWEAIKGTTEAKRFGLTFTRIELNSSGKISYLEMPNSLWAHSVAYSPLGEEE